MRTDSVLVIVGSHPTNHGLAIFNALNAMGKSPTLSGDDNPYFWISDSLYIAAQAYFAIDGVADLSLSEYLLKLGF